MKPSNCRNHRIPRNRNDAICQTYRRKKAQKAQKEEPEIRDSPCFGGRGPRGLFLRLLSLFVAIALVRNSEVVGAYCGLRRETGSRDGVLPDQFFGQRRPEAGLVRGEVKAILIRGHHGRHQFGLGFIRTKTLGPLTLSGGQAKR
jgi:hypothetical protein